MYVKGFEQGKIKFKPRVKLYHKIYIHLVILAFQSINLIGSLSWAILHKDYYSFKIFLSFWLAQIPRLIVMQNQKFYSHSLVIFEIVPKFRRPQPPLTPATPIPHDHLHTYTFLQTSRLT